MPYYSILCYTMSYCVILCQTIPYYAMIYHITPLFAILCHTPWPPLLPPLLLLWPRITSQLRLLTTSRSKPVPVSPEQPGWRAWAVTHRPASAHARHQTTVPYVCVCCFQGFYQAVKLLIKPDIVAVAAAVDNIVNDIVTRGNAHHHPRNITEYFKQFWLESLQWAVIVICEWWARPQYSGVHGGDRKVEKVLIWKNWSV